MSAPKKQCKTALAALLLAAALSGIATPTSGFTLRRRVVAQSGESQAGVTSLGSGAKVAVEASPVDPDEVAIAVHPRATNPPSLDSDEELLGEAVVENADESNQTVSPVLVRRVRAMVPERVQRKMLSVLPVTVLLSVIATAILTGWQYEGGPSKLYPGWVNSKGKDVYYEKDGSGDLQDISVYGGWEGAHPYFLTGMSAVSLQILPLIAARAARLDALLSSNAATRDRCSQHFHLLSGMVSGAAIAPMAYFPFYKMLHFLFVVIIFVPNMFFQCSDERLRRAVHNSRGTDAGKRLSVLKTLAWVSMIVNLFLWGLASFFRASRPYAPVFQYLAVAAPFVVPLSWSSDLPELAGTNESAVEGEAEQQPPVEVEAGELSERGGVLFEMPCSVAAI